MALARGTRSPLAANPTPTRPRTRLAVESLEDRTTPAGGMLDPTFGTGGVVTDAVGANNNTAFDVAVQPDGKVVAVGEVIPPAGGTNFAVARYHPDGSRDASFGTGGVATTDIRYYDRAQAVAVLPGGKLIVAGTTTAVKGFKLTHDFAVVRYNANGTLDTTFGSKGVAATDLGSASDFAFDMTVQPDGKIVVAGTTAARGYGTYALVRYNANGTLDATFGSGGKVVTTLAVGTNDAGVALDGSGRIVLGGTTTGNDYVVARFSPGGQVDTSFGAGGVVTTDFTGGTDRLTTLSVLSDGKIVAVGMTEYQAVGRYRSAGLARYNSDGTLDSTFGQGGTVIGTPDPDQSVGSDPSTDSGLSASAMVVQADGKILVGGQGGFRAGYGPTNAFVMMRFHPDGSTDLDYGPTGQGVVRTPIGTYADVRAVAVQADGSAILAGFTETPPGGTVFALARYLPGGPAVGAFAGPPGPVAAGDPVSLLAGGVTNGNPGASVTGVAFYRDTNGDGRLDGGDELLGSGAANGDGTWSLTFSTAGWAAGTYTLFARAADSFGAAGDPISLTLQVV